MRWLLDEMFPPSLADELRRLGHDAVCVRERDLVSAADVAIYNVAAEEGRILLTENFKDFANIMNAHVAQGGRGIPLAFVRKTKLPRGGAFTPYLAGQLDAWAEANPDPHPGVYWP